MIHKSYPSYVTIVRFSAVAFLITIAAAAVGAESIRFTGTGTLSCGVWIEARNKGNDDQADLHVQWVAGYLAGHNYYRANKVSQATPQDLPTIALWLDTYCGNNPTHVTIAAAAALVQELGGAKALHQWKR